MRKPLFRFVRGVMHDPGIHKRSVGVLHRGVIGVVDEEEVFMRMTPENIGNYVRRVAFDGLVD